jgi:manganese/zinc/iron transport system substrate-binding protein
MGQSVRNSSIVLGLVLFASLVGCESSASSKTDSSPADSAQSGTPLSIVCTTGQVGDMVANLGGEHVKIETLMGPGVDPHLYRGTLADTQRLNRADAVFYNGLHLEGRLAEALESLAERKPVFAVTEDIVANSPELLRKPPEFDGNYDPHVWFDVSLWSRCTETAMRRLVELDPAHADEYRANSAAYIAKLEKLHSWCKTRIGEIPNDRRLLTTAHDAFGYFGRAYDIEVHGLQGVSTADEADLATINELVDLLVTRKVKAVFVESSVPPKNIQSLIQGCAARDHTVVEGGELFSDALGPAGTPEAEYIGMVEHNVNTIVKALK